MGTIIPYQLVSNSGVTFHPSLGEGCLKEIMPWPLLETIQCFVSAYFNKVQPFIWFTSQTPYFIEYNSITPYITLTWILSKVYCLSYENLVKHYWLQRQNHLVPQVLSILLVSFLLMWCSSLHPVNHVTFQNQQSLVKNQ